MRRPLPLLIVALVTLGAAAGAKPPAEPRPPAEPETPAREEITIAGERFRLEVAADPERRRRGLMEREMIEADGGMIFIFPDDRVRRFWMANCRVDIDLLFVDRRGRIVWLHRMKAEPPRQPRESQAMYEYRLRRYSSVRPARFAIELRAGTIDRLKLQRGRLLELDLERLQKLAR